MKAIAAEAGVAVQTVYASMKTKPDILRAVIELTVRDEEVQVPLAESSRWQETEQASDPRAKLAMFARIHREICDREGAIFAVLETAAVVEPELGPLPRKGAVSLRGSGPGRALAELARAAARRTPR